jgi:predicted cobalt transporter CbtA
MTWSDVTRPPSIPVLRQFGWICGVAGIGVGLYLALHGGEWGLAMAPAGAGMICAILGQLRPGLLRWPFTLAMAAAFPIGFVVSNLVLALVFFGVPLPQK